ARPCRGPVHTYELPAARLLASSSGSLSSNAKHSCQSVAQVCSHALTSRATLPGRPRDGTRIARSRMEPPQVLVDMEPGAERVADGLADGGLSVVVAGEDATGHHPRVQERDLVGDLFGGVVRVNVGEPDRPGPPSGPVAPLHPPRGDVHRGGGRG